jgi:hypothetical protein
MNRTIKDFLEEANQYHTLVEKYGIALSNEKLQNIILTLQSNIRTIQAVSKRIADISNVVNDFVIKRKNPQQIKYIDPYPSENDHTTLTNLQAEEKSELLPNISIPIKRVPSSAYITPQPIYFLEDVQLYAININGVILKGDLANISDYRTTHTALCEYGVKCRSIQTCKYYHDVEDYKKLSLPVPKNKRNFTVGSWIYSKNRNPKTYFTRHVGGANTLIDDLKCIRKIQYKEEIINREGQLIHDLLIYMVLLQQGLIDKYVKWW